MENNISVIGRIDIAARTIRTNTDCVFELLDTAYFDVSLELIGMTDGEEITVTGTLILPIDSERYLIEARGIKG